jgi:predicted RNase H-like HicB family nuclease
MSYRLTAVIEKDSDGYYAYCPELKGCQSQGDTFKEAQANIQEAIGLYVETLCIGSPKIFARQSRG